MTNKKFFIIISIILLVIYALSVNAQPGGDEDVVDVPIDGGLAWLVAAGAGLAISRYKRFKYEKNKSKN